MSDLFKLLKIIRTPKIGPITFWKAYHQEKSLDAALSFLSKKLNLIDDQVIKKEIEDCADHDIKLIPFYDELYPKALKNIADAPPLLSVKGNVDTLNKKSIAIVGSRSASLNARSFTKSLATDLGFKNYVIVSGLARGVDTSAHEGSLKTGTIAVVAGGLNQIYPPENKDLFHQICEQGCIISEMPFGTKPAHHLFPRRNRLIPALSKATVVVEATAKSGSLITASYALDYNREVFALPGFPKDPRSYGPNKLIKQGAHLLENAQDIIEILENKYIKPVEQPVLALKEDTTLFNAENLKDQILKDLKSEPLSIHELLDSYEDPSHKVLEAVAELEISDQISRQND